MKLRNESRAFVIRLDASDKTYFTDEGYFRDSPIVGRIGIQVYHNADGSERKEFRPPEEVFDPESLKSFLGKPIIITHDAGYIDKENAPDEEIGTIISEGYKDGDFVRCDIVIHDTDSLKDCGLRELSLGYNSDFDYTPGEYEGEHYDVVQKNIRINHLALVAEARAGNKARLNIDGKDRVTDNITPQEGGHKLMGKRRFDGEISEEEFGKKLEDLTAKDETPAEEIIPEAEEEKTDEEPELTAEEKIAEVRAHQDRRDGDEEGPQDLEEASKIIDEQEKDIQTLLDCIDEMESEKDVEKTDEEEEPKEEEEKVPLTQDGIDRNFRERLALVRLGDKLNMDGLETMGIVAGQKAIIKKVYPNLKLDGEDKAYIKALYNIAADKVNTLHKNSIALQKRQMRGGMNMDGAPKMGMTMAQKARERMIARNEGGNE